MIEPTEEDIDRKVIYNARHPGAKDEYGRITSFNDSYVFVRYNPHGDTSQATNREDLRWDK